MQPPQIVALVDVIAEELARSPPARVLLVGMDWPELPPPPQLDACPHGADLPGAPPGAQRADLALVLHPDDGLDTASCLQPGLAAALASLRDLHAARVLLAMPLADSATRRDAQRTQLRALGFSAARHVEHGGRTLLAHRFDLADYKPTPQWLNPSNWAHPELWNRHRW